jgi:hypothetical protein
VREGGIWGHTLICDLIIWKVSLSFASAEILSFIGIRSWKECRIQKHLTRQRKGETMELKDIRRKVDKIDRELLVLLQERMGLALRSSKFKETINDLLTTTDLKVIGEARIRVNHCLLATDVTDYRDIRLVYSHPQALAQCRGFLMRNHLEPRPYYDTAGAAKMLARENHPVLEKMERMTISLKRLGSYPANGTEC